MLLKNISNEFNELRELLEENGSYNNRAVNLWREDKNEYTLADMLDLIPFTRILTSQQHILKSKTFKSKSVERYKNEYLRLSSKFIDCLDEYMGCFANQKNKDDVKLYFDHLKRNSERIYEIIIKIIYAYEIIEMVSVETWEPLPPTINKDEYKNVTILSESKNVSLSGMSKDISTLDNFLNNISLLIKGNKGNNFYLRKVESGSLAIVISCMVGASQIVSFIFFYIKLYQNAEKRELKNIDRKLELINKSLDSAKKILEVDPQNTEANEIIQKCGLCILEFLENNPKGTINDQNYDIGVEKLKLEEKEED